ncbi:hypothetical protein ACCO45_011017 [Purpureocillium lilacinum]|uniref:Uncharacterized protein n=1 Tax=Purpureocillium lilacinum TaxID=33203 RepID=A0ACC4DIS3_PURLI
MPHSPPAWLLYGTKKGHPAWPYRYQGRAGRSLVGAEHQPELDVFPVPTAIRPRSHALFASAIDGVDCTGSNTARGRRAKSTGFASSTIPAGAPPARTEKSKGLTGPIRPPEFSVAP